MLDPVRSTLRGEVSPTQARNWIIPNDKSRNDAKEAKLSAATGIYREQKLDLGAKKPVLAAKTRRPISRFIPCQACLFHPFHTFIPSHLTSPPSSHLSPIPIRSADTHLRYPKLTASRYLPYSQPLPAQPQQKCRRTSKPSISNRSPRSQWVRICAMATPRISSPSSLYVNTAFLNNPRCPC